jgi:hypothetical protein
MKETFQEFAAKHGVIIDHVIEDGQVHRVPVEGKGPRNKSGMYAFYNDARGRAGWVRNYFATGDKVFKYGEQAEDFHKNANAVEYYKQKEDQEQYHQAPSQA